MTLSYKLRPFTEGLPINVTVQSWGAREMNKGLLWTAVAMLQPWHNTQERRKHPSSPRLRRDKWLKWLAQSKATARSDRMPRFTERLPYQPSLSLTLPCRDHRIES